MGEGGVSGIHLCGVNGVQRVNGDSDLAPMLSQGILYKILRAHQGQLLLILVYIDQLLGTDCHWEEGVTFV